MNAEIIIFLILPILIITTVIALILKFYLGIWNIHISINKQNELIEEQNEILLKFLEIEDEKRRNNS